MHTIICGNHKYCAQLYFFHLVFTDVRSGLVLFFLVCTELFLDVIFEFPRITLSSEINKLSRWLLSIGMVLIFITYTHMHTNTLFFLNRYLCMFTHTVSRDARKKSTKKIQQKKNKYVYSHEKRADFPTVASALALSFRIWYTEERTKNHRQKRTNNQIKLQWFHFWRTNPTPMLSCCIHAHTKLFFSMRIFMAIQASCLLIRFVCVNWDDKRSIVFFYLPFAIILAELIKQQLNQCIERKRKDTLWFIFVLIRQFDCFRR